jgi:hypothetical protein
MIKDVMQSIAAAARKLFTNWGALLISLILYVALLGSVFLFFNIGVATVFQVVASIVLLPLATLMLFFVLQGLGVSYVRVGVGPLYLLKRAIQDCWRILLITIPVVLIAFGLYYGIAHLEHAAFHSIAGAASTSAQNSVSTRRSFEMGFEILRFLVFFFGLPLIAIHLWISVVREGLKNAVKDFARSIYRAFAFRSMLIYLLTAILFGGISYLLLANRISIKNEWTELWVVGIKTAIALFILFVGWFLAIGALAEMTARKAFEELDV